jgi:hypothetical protein
MLVLDGCLSQQGKMQGLYGMRSIEHESHGFLNTNNALGECYMGLSQMASQAVVRLHMVIQEITHIHCLPSARPYAHEDKPWSIAYALNRRHRCLKSSACNVHAEKRIHGQMIQISINGTLDRNHTSCGDATGTCWSESSSPVPLEEGTDRRGVVDVERCSTR